MISLLRIALIMLIIFLIQRAFAGKKTATGTNGNDIKVNDPKPSRKPKVPKEIGEYIDYEDVKK